MAKQKPHLQESRWRKHKHLGMTPDAIAAEEGVSVTVIKKSIREIELRRTLNTRAEMEHSQVGLIQALTDLEHEAIAGALTATKIVKNPKTSKFVEVPDHETRLAGVDKVTAKVIAVQPKLKGQGTIVNLGIQNNGQAALAGSNQAVGFEDVFRKIKSRQLAQLPAANVEIVDAEEVAE